MFKTVKAYRTIYRTVKAERIHEREQRQLDLLRYHNADRPEMQLHLDRMQTGINLKRLNSL